MEQTAIDWLEERFNKYVAWEEGQYKATSYTIDELFKDFEQAKELERQQIEEAFINGQLSQCGDLNVSEEQYYTSKYGTK